MRSVPSVDHEVLVESLYLFISSSAELPVSLLWLSARRQPQSRSRQKQASSSGRPRPPAACLVPPPRQKPTRTPLVPTVDSRLVVTVLPALPFRLARSAAPNWPLRGFGEPPPSLAPGPRLVSVPRTQSFPTSETAAAPHRFLSPRSGAAAEPARPFARPPGAAGGLSRQLPLLLPLAFGPRAGRSRTRPVGVAPRPPLSLAAGFFSDVRPQSFLRQSPFRSLRPPIFRRSGSFAAPLRWTSRSRQGELWRH